MNEAAKLRSLDLCGVMVSILSQIDRGPGCHLSWCPGEGPGDVIYAGLQRSLESSNLMSVTHDHQLAFYYKQMM